jgi:hypothetical protein
VVKALKSVFSDTKLFPARPRAVLPRLTIRGVKTGSEVYQQETHRRCLEATVQHAILTAIRDAITAAMPQRAALSDDTVGKSVLEPVASYGVTYECPDTFALFAVDVGAYARWRAHRSTEHAAAHPPLAPLPPAGADENARPASGVW